MKPAPILYLYEKCRALVNRGMPVSVLKEDKIFRRIIAIKYEVPNKELERFDEIYADIDRFYDSNTGKKRLKEGSVCSNRISGLSKINLASPCP